MGVTRSNWVEPGYTRSQVDRAGRAFVSLDGDLDEIESAIEVFTNWRASHGYPLNTAQIVLRARVKKVGQSGLVSQRHKRELSIVRKLERSRTMRLSQMQDIAGCRAVLATNRQVALLRKYYESTVRDDYILQPARSGYRSIHAVAKYEGKSKTAFDGLLVETQLRSAIQHAWATAVETVDSFTGSDLKSGYGEERWRRLFALVSSAFAIREHCPIVPGTPDQLQKLGAEIRDLEAELGLVGRLKAWHRTSQFVRDPQFRFKKYLLIEQWPNSGAIKLHTFSADQFDVASKRYSELEQQVNSQNRLQVVMASADSLASLKRAFPNFFVDPTEFLKAYGRVLASVTRR